jgi:hypothetical protein
MTHQQDGEAVARHRIASPKASGVRHRAAFPGATLRGAPRAAADGGENIAALNFGRD